MRKIVPRILDMTKEIYLNCERTEQFLKENTILTYYSLIKLKCDHCMPNYYRKQFYVKKPKSMIITQLSFFGLLEEKNRLSH